MFYNTPSAGQKNVLKAVKHIYECMHQGMDK
jgi:hypothetical protein